MPRLLPSSVRIILIMLLAVPLALRSASIQASPAPAARSDGLDTPLTTNLCGASEPGATDFTFATTGDTLLHANIQAVAEKRGYDYLFDYTRPFIKAADFAYTNFEGVSLPGSAYTGYPQFNYSPKLAPAIKRAGFGVVSTANNHAMDRGPAGVDSTAAVLQQAGLSYHGTTPRGAAKKPYVPLTLTRNGVRITAAFLSFTWGTNGLSDPYGQVNLLWQSNNYNRQGGVRQSVLDAIAQAKRETDVVIVAAHWGHEYVFYPEAAQISGAKQLAAAGADVVLGDHPHTLEPVDVIDTQGRKTLVIYSLGNFVASQGAFQAKSFTSTGAIFYVGLLRGADGRVRVSGYRYLPTISVDQDTRPAPIAAGALPSVQAHVRLMMRDPSGTRQVPANPAAIGGHVDVCPQSAAPAPKTPPTSPTPQTPSIDSDFVQHMNTLGSGTTRHPDAEVRAVFGAPVGGVKEELTGDCRRTTRVLYTERQRLELQPGVNWPYRVVGTQLGTVVYRQKYGMNAVQRRLNLAGDAIGNDLFRQFFQRYGGLPIFGYPVSGILTERDSVTGQAKTVQYFERARFELNPSAPPNADLLTKVQLGLLTREYAGIAAHCAAGAAMGGSNGGNGAQAGAPQVASLGRPSTSAPAATAAKPAARPQLQVSEAGAALPITVTAGQPWGNWIPGAIGGVFLPGVAAGGVWWWRRRGKHQQQ